MTLPHRLRSLRNAAALLALGLAACLHVQASVVIAGTRVIYNAQERETTVKLSNKGTQPVLTQSWVDNGNPNAAPGTIDVPFTVTPPVARIDPDKAQTLRIFHTGEALPKDRESVFWLNVLEVPPKPTAGEADRNYLQLAFRSRIKLFYRPANLTGHAQDAPTQLAWRLVDGRGKAMLEVHNPTPFHVSFASIEARSGSQRATFEDGGMVAPGQTERFPLKEGLTASATATVHYRAINDYGGITEGDAPLSTAPLAR